MVSNTYAMPYWKGRGVNEAFEKATVRGNSVNQEDEG